MPRPSEFDLIRDYFTCDFPQADDVLLGIGDDCSLVSPPLDMELAQSIDTQVAGVHFPVNAPAHLIAARALRCATSDLAAMGAVPQGFHLALTLPESNTEFLAEFARGLRQTAHELQMPLLGGDTTRGSTLTITIAVQGWLPQGLGLRRTGAVVGQDIWLSGKIGAAALILERVLETPELDDASTAPYYHPQVHVTFGHVLLSLATSAIDISDGLLQDARHIARASGVDFELDAAAIPTCVPQGNARWADCLTGGDDYQLLFTAPEDARDRVLACAQTIHLNNCTRVGTVNKGTGDVVVMSDGVPLTFAREGYEHF